ncbi:polyprenol phosphomannose-dependent alpha 1,6 mannosyltransferase MptB [Gordonia sp. CPCC 205333]|uniref:polyprenol phosphomannose-dependent alpha 1,6 mannosyltransferase MptB n=1 Tax=Gordonia sp. CPCC 205333 TaxID=3140790 RepID=UPI003AF3E862
MRTPRELWCGVVGSVLVAIGAFGIADIPRNSEPAQRWFLDVLTYGHGKTLSAIVFWTGVATLVICWMRVGRLLLAGGEKSPSAPTVRQMRWAALGWAAPLMVTVPIYSRDVYAYLAQAAVFREGFNPYTDGPVHYPGPLLDSMAQVWAATTAPYGPAFVALMRGVVGITGDHVILGVLAVRLILLPGLLLALWAIPRLAKHFGASGQTGLWLALLNPLILIHVVGGPHVELLMMGLLVAGVTLVVERRHLWGLAVLGLAVSIKITAGVAIPFVVWIWLSHIRDDRTGSATRTDTVQIPLWRLGWRTVTGAFAATAVIPVAVFAFWTTVTGLGMGWLSGLGWADRIINWLTVPTLVGHIVTWVAAPFTALNLQPVLSVTRLIGAVALAGILLWMWWRGRIGERAAMTSLLWAMFAVLLLEPSTLPWYYTWVLCLIAAVTLPTTARAWIIGASVVGLIVFQPDDSIVLYKPVELVLAFALGALAGWSLQHRDPLRLGGAARWGWYGSSTRQDAESAGAESVRTP